MSRGNERILFAGRCCLWRFSRFPRSLAFEESKGVGMRKERVAERGLFELKIRSVSSFQAFGRRMESIASRYACSFCSKERAAAAGLVEGMRRMSSPLLKNKAGNDLFSKA